MPTIYTSTGDLANADAAGEVTTISRYATINSFYDIGWGGVRLNNLGTILDMGIVFSGRADVLYNYKTGLIFATGDAVTAHIGLGPASDISVTTNNYGEIYSTGGAAIKYSYGTLGTILNTGNVESETKAAIHGNGGVITKIDNSGTISGYEAILLEGSASRTTIINSGSIVADVYALRTGGGSTFTLTNTGVIDGIISSGTVNGADAITNSGRMLDNVVLGPGNDSYVGKGSAYAFRVYGDVGNDKLIGSAAADTFYGQEDIDTLNGGGGNDKLIGGLGRDAMTGGTGNDIFYFNAVSDSTAASGGRDTILDFVHGQDKLNLAAIDANGAAAGDTAFRFIAAEGAAFSAGVAGQVRWDQVDAAGTASDRTYVFADLDGNRTVDFTIALVGLKALTASDFVL